MGHVLLLSNRSHISLYINNYHCQNHGEDNMVLSLSLAFSSITIALGYMMDCGRTEFDAFMRFYVYHESIIITLVTAKIDQRSM